MNTLIFFFVFFRLTQGFRLQAARDAGQAARGPRHVPLRGAPDPLLRRVRAPTSSRPPPCPPPGPSAPKAATVHPRDKSQNLNFEVRTHMREESPC